MIRRIERWWGKIGWETGKADLKCTAWIVYRHFTKYYRKNYSSIHSFYTRRSWFRLDISFFATSTTQNVLSCSVKSFSCLQSSHPRDRLALTRSRQIRSSIRICRWSPSQARPSNLFPLQCWLLNDHQHWNQICRKSQAECWECTTATRCSQSPTEESRRGFIIW